MALIGVTIFAFLAVYKHANTDSVKFRAYTQLSCVEMINISPVIGTGLGTFYVAYPSWRRPQIFFIEGKHNTETDHAENEYMELWHDEGIIGVSIFFWILIMLGVGSYKIIQAYKSRIINNPESEKPYLELGLIAVIAGMLLHNLFYCHLRFYTTGLFFWVAGGLCFSLIINYQSLKNENVKISNNSKHIPLRIILGIIILILGVFFVSKFGKYFEGNYHLNRAVYYSKQGNWPEALKEYNIVTQKNYGFIMAHYFMGNVYNDRWNLNREYHPEWGDNETDDPWTNIDPGKKGRVDPERSLSKYTEVWKLAPNYVQSHHQAGLVYLKLGDYFKSVKNMEKAQLYWNKAIAEFERYHDTDPIFDQNYYRLAWAYLQLSYPDKAEESYMRHLYTREALVKAGNTERGWVSAQFGRTVTSIPDSCKIHDGIYHSFYWEDWGKRRNSDYNETYVKLGNLKK